MKLLIVISMVIIFISAFFIFFIYEATVKEHVSCFFKAGESCSTGSPLSMFIIGLIMMVFFIIIDFAVIYILLKILQSSPSGYAIS